MPRPLSELNRLIDNALAVPLLLAGMVVLGGVLRFIVAGQDLFADELATYWIVRTNSLPEAVEAVGTTAEISPPLGFILTWLTTPISARFDIPLTPELIRLPALIAGIASIPIVYLVGSRTVGRAGALLAAALTTLSPFMVFYSAEARSYSVMMALVLLSTLMLLLAIDRRRPGWWIGYTVFVCMAAYTHYTSIFVLGAQFAWAMWLHPEARRSLLLATSAAALIYVPWLPSLKEDLDSPTTQILSLLFPFDFDSVLSYVSRWSIGFPTPNVRYTDVPGIPGLVLIGAGLLVGTAGMILWRHRLRSWFAAHDWRIALVGLLALATPAGEAAVSLIGSNVISTRNLAASWPYLALTFAALITVGSMRLRVLAATLVVAGFAIGAAKMVTPDLERPRYSEVTQLVDDLSAAVVVDASAFTPGPLSNFEVVTTTPEAEVLRLNIPEQRTDPFDLADRLTEPAEIASRAVAASSGGPIVVVTSPSDKAIDSLNTPAVRVRDSRLVAEFVDALPPAYELVSSRLIPGLVTLEALVFTRPT